MIIHIVGQQMDGLAVASDTLPTGFKITDDDRVEDLETGTSTFNFTVEYDFSADISKPFSRAKAAEVFKVGNHIIKQNNPGTVDGDQVYTIINTEENLKDGTISVQSEDLGLELLNNLLPAAENVTGTAADFMRTALADSGYLFGTDESLGTQAKTLSFDEETAQSRVLNIATAFEMKVRYRYEFNGIVLTKKQIDFVKSRGYPYGVQLHMNKDIRDISITNDITDLATAIDVKGTNDVGNDITLDGYNYDDGNFYIRGTQLRSKTARAKWTQYLQGQNSEGYLVASWTYDTKVRDQKELCDAAVKHLKEICDVKVTYDVDLYEDVPERYDIKIGDTISIVDDDVSELYLTAVVQKYEISETTATVKLTLGDYELQSSGITDRVKALADKVSYKLNNIRVYTWIVYADDASGANMGLTPTYVDTDGIQHQHTYLGIATNRVDPEPDMSDPTVYVFSKIVGDKGADGKDAIQYYLHIAYCNKDANGNYKDFSTTDSDGRWYIGTYTDTKELGATVPNAYKWQLVRGKDAEDQYTHFAYGNKDANGNIINFSVSDSTGKEYLGILVDYNATPSDKPADYSWSKIKGDDGFTPDISVTKADGIAKITVKDKDGNVTSEATLDKSFVHIRYSNDGGKTFTAQDGKATGKYIGVYSDYIELDSDDVGAYTWSRLQGDSIQSVVPMYYLSSSNAEPKDGEWSESVPTYKDGYYYWQRLHIIYTNGSSEDTTPSLDNTLTNANTIAQEAQERIKNVEKVAVKQYIQQYYLSSSDKELKDGEWSNTFPSRMGIKVIDGEGDEEGTIIFVPTGVIPGTVGYDEETETLDFSSSGEAFYSATYDEDEQMLVLGNARSTASYYWIRYKKIYADDHIEYEPSENGQLLTNINDLWADVVTNTTNITQTNSQIKSVATTVTEATSPYGVDLKTWVSRTQSSITQMSDQISLSITYEDAISTFPRKAEIIMAINNNKQTDEKGSVIKIKADNVEITGHAVFEAVKTNTNTEEKLLMPGDLGPQGQTKIDGGRIDTDTLIVKHIEAKTIVADNIKDLSASNDDGWSIQWKNGKLDHFTVGKLSAGMIESGFTQTETFGLSGNVYMNKERCRFSDTVVDSLSSNTTILGYGYDYKKTWTQGSAVLIKSEHSLFLNWDGGTGHLNIMIDGTYMGYLTERDSKTHQW